MKIDSASAICDNVYRKIEVGTAAGHIEIYVSYGKRTTASTSAPGHFDLHIKVCKDHAAWITQTPATCVSTIAGWRLQVNRDIYRLSGVDISAQSLNGWTVHYIVAHKHYGI